MKIESFLDVDAVALEAADQVSVLLQLTAPELVADSERVPATLVMVLDRSGSMSGERLAAAKQALAALVERLDPADQFGLVVFDDVAEVVVPAGRLTDKAAVVNAIEQVRAGGSTDLSAGYLRGLQEAARAGGENVRVLLLSDGHANQGVTDPDRLAALARKAATADGVTTTTLGLGLGYDEHLLGAMSRSGNGAALFAEEADAAAGAVAGEVDGLLTQSVTAASLLVRPSAHVDGVLVVNDLQTNGVEDGILVELGGFISGESRKVVLTFDIPAMGSLGPVEVAALVIRYVTVPDLVEEVVEVPVRVNVVPGDEAAGRPVNPVVRSELAFQRVQATKREASQALRRGDLDGAGDALRLALEAVSHGAVGAPPEYLEDFDQESTVLRAMLTEAEEGSASRASKTLWADQQGKTHFRGRPRRDR